MKVKKDGWVNKLADKMVNLLIEASVNFSCDIQSLRKKLVYAKCKMNNRRL
ncbi:MAG: hypothetical protein U0T83_11010 [Bacteriovoracaceae bacterium]